MFYILRANQKFIRCLRSPWSILVATVVGVSLAAFVPVVGHAYDFSAVELEGIQQPYGGFSGSVGQQERMRERLQDQQIQQKNQAQRDQWNRDRGYRPEDYNAPAPYTFSTPGRSLVCRDGVNRSIVCQ
jgi:hypothetical protein